MMLPSLELIDLERGGPLPWRSDEPGVQYNRLYSGKWAVRINGPWSGQVGIVAVHSASPPLPLRREAGEPNVWRLPKDDELEAQSHSKLNDLKKKYRQVGDAAGRLQITLLDEHGRLVPAAPVALLDVLPGNITEQQMSRMVREIGLLALSATSHVAGKDLMTATEDGIGPTVYGTRVHPADDAQLAAAGALQDMISLLRREIPHLEARPLSSIRVEVSPTRPHKATYHARRFQRPNVLAERRTVVAQTRVESIDCSENRFVLYVLNSLSALARGMQLRLEEQPPEIGPRPSGRSFIPNLIAQVENVQRSYQVARGDLIRKRTQTASELASSVRWLEQVKQEPFWSHVSETAQPTHSLRLLGAPFYSAIYSRYRSLWGSSVTKISPVASLLDHTERGNIRPAWETYELWCFVFLYCSLIQEIRGLRPVQGSLLERLTIKDGELRLLKNVPFTLEGTLPDQRSLRFRLWYEPQLEDRDGNPRKPDILLELCIGQAASMYFAFDCKYRDYTAQGKEVLIDDIYGVAKLKYLNSGLRFRDSPEELNINASFVLHTSKEIDYWGEVPLWALVSRFWGNDAASCAYNVHLTDRIAVPEGLSQIVCKHHSEMAEPS